MPINERIILAIKKGNLVDKCENKYLYKYLNSQPLLVPKLTNFKSYNYQNTFET